MPITIQTGVPRVPVDPVQTKKLRRQLIFRIGLGTTLILLCFAFMLRLWAYEAMVITSGSMEPTLLKFDYTLLDHRVILRGKWRRGDVVVFTAPPQWRLPGQTLVKRVIGLPGETVQVRDGIYRINNRPLIEKYLPPHDPDDNTFPVTLGPDEYFVSGDNRDNSDDSRNNGPIQNADIQGRVLGVLWPPGNIGSLPAPIYEFLPQPAQ